MTEKEWDEKVARGGGDRGVPTRPSGKVVGREGKSWGRAEKMILPGSSLRQIKIFISPTK
jgi:hypothetical protein